MYTWTKCFTVVKHPRIKVHISNMFFCYDYMFSIDIIFSLLKSRSVEIGENRWRDIYKRGLRPLVKVCCFLILKIENDLIFLNALTDLIVRVWSTGTKYLKTLIGDKSEVELVHSIHLRSTDKNIWRPPWALIKPNLIQICDWAF